MRIAFGKMNMLEIIGLFTIIIITIVVLYLLYRYIFGYSYNSCPNNHDLMARYGTKNVINV